MAGEPSVLVGYDGTKESEHAVRWAVEEARLRRRNLEVCHSWQQRYQISHIDYDIEDTMRRMGRHVLDGGVRLARELGGSVHVEGKLLDGPAYAALMHESYDAELIVIGSHGDQALAFGSTAQRLPARSHLPVLVARGPGPVHGRVAVGVDGSAGSDVALAFAFEEAALRDWRLEAVLGCQEPGEEGRRMCGAVLQRAVTPWSDKYPRMTVETTLIMGEPRTALLDAAERADMIVVGDRGAGTVRPLLLGSTSTALLQQAPCTVAVIHAPSVS